MQAIERELLSNNWTTILFVSGLLLLFLLKRYDAKKMRGYSLSIFNKGFVEIESQEKHAGFSFFHIVFTVFSFVSISVTAYFLLIQYGGKTAYNFLEYTKISTYILIYMIGRFILEFVLMKLLKTEEILRHFFLSKRSYLYSISIGLFFLNIIYFYGFQKVIFLVSGVVLLFAIRLFLILTNNKGPIVKELFYFILYLCAFEIAPLLILFKLIF